MVWHNDILTFVPRQDLAPDTTYEVVLTDGGIKDVCGNGIEGYSFRFSTGSEVGGNEPPSIDTFTIISTQPAPGEQVRLSAVATDPEDGALSYRFDPGDGSSPTDWSDSQTTTHTYNTTGRYLASVQVRDEQGAVSSANLSVTVHQAPSTAPGPHSAPIVVDADSRRGWTVNPDNASVTCFDLDRLRKLWEVPVGNDPRSIALDQTGTLWVACHDADRVYRINSSTGERLGSVATGYGSAPIAVLASPDDTTIWVSCTGSGEILAIQRSSGTITNRQTLGPSAKSLACTALMDHVCSSAASSARPKVITGAPLTPTASRMIIITVKSGRWPPPTSASPGPFVWSMTEDCMAAWVMIPKVPLLAGARQTMSAPWQWTR